MYVTLVNLDLSYSLGLKQFLYWVTLVIYLSMSFNFMHTWNIYGMDIMYVLSTLHSLLTTSLSESHSWHDHWPPPQVRDILLSFTECPFSISLVVCSASIVIGEFDDNNHNGVHSRVGPLLCCWTSAISICVVNLPWFIDCPAIPVVPNSEQNYWVMMFVMLL